MKKLPILMYLLTSLCLISISSPSQLYGKNGDDSIKVWSSPDLNELTLNLVQAYHEEFPDVKITETSNLYPQEKIEQGNNIGLITKSYFSEYDCDMSWRLAVGRDILIPVMNPENPFRKKIEAKGVSPEEFRNLFTQGESKNWGILLNNGQSAPINCWCLPESSTRSYLANFFDTDPSNIKSNKVNNLEELLDRIGNDKYALGFCRLANVINPETRKTDSRVIPVPIDINANNKVDYFEDIYSNVNELERGIWIGKYPKELFSCIYLITSLPLADENEQGFMKWLLTDGQDYLFLSGYTELAYSERNSKIQSLVAPTLPLSSKIEQPVKTINIFLIIFIVLGVLTTLVFLIMRRRPDPQDHEELRQPARVPSFGENSVKVQRGLFFDKSHTWAFMEKNGIVKTGIDDFLQHVTGKITRVIMKKAGEKVVKGEAYLTLVQDGKHLEIKSPVSGIIVAANEKLNRHPVLISSHPLTDGWVYSIESSNWVKDLKVFLMGEEYIKWLKSEFSRLKDFLAFKIKPHSGEEFNVVMQEGGELKDGLLEHFGPEVWEEFQTGFMNNSR